METMETPTINPVVRPTGKATRYVKDTRSHRNVRLDQISDNRLMTACKWLSGETAKDCVSCSAVIRRAVRLYTQRLEQLRATTDPTLWAEKEAVRERTKLPNGPRRKATLWDSPGKGDKPQEVKSS